MFNWNYFPREVLSSWQVFIGNLIWILTMVAWTGRGRNDYVMFVSYYLHKFLKLQISKPKKLCQFQKQSPEVLCKKAVLKNLAIFTGKALCWSPFLIEWHAWRAAILLKETPTQVFSCDYCKIFKSTYFQENLRTIGPTNLASYYSYFFLGACFWS